MSYSSKKMAQIIRTGGGTDISKIKPRRRKKTVLGLLSSAGKRRRDSSALKSYFM